MPKMRAVQVSRPKGPFELVERDIPNPSAGMVRIKVQSCGVCHSDSFTKEGAFPNIQYPRIPGHEVAGIIDSVGPHVLEWKIGQRVGVGWNGGYCTHCNPCRHGDFMNCSNMKVCGISYDGGYAEYMLAPVEALALIPKEISPQEAGPLMCAGVTTFNALRNSGAIAGDTVAILGIGGLGHLAIQYAAKMGFNTIAIARGAEKQALAKKLGAHHYIDSQAQDPSAELNKLGGAKLILSTITSSKAVEAVINGIAVNGKLLMVGVADAPLEIAPFWLIGANRSVAGWASGTSIDSEETMDFSARAGIRSMNEVFPLEKAAEAYDRMVSGKARFRVVLVTGH